MVSYILLYAVVMSLLIKLVEGSFSINDTRNDTAESQKSEAVNEFQ
jgi:hypothetical protein